MSPQDTSEDRASDTLATDDEGILAELRERLALSIAADDQNREAGLDDLQFISGEQWDPQDRQQRALSARPCLTINKLPTFLHQVTNDQRQNKTAIKIHAVDNGADKVKAQIVQGLVRHIEYSSNSTVATATAVNSAATIGFGYYRLVTRYVDEKSFDQEVCYKRIRNPFTVYMDPNIQEPDGSDQQWCIVSEKVPRTEVKRKYPKAKVLDSSSLPTGTGDTSLMNWWGDNYVRLAEYYRIEYTKARLVMTDGGETMWEDDAKKIGAFIRLGRNGKPMARESFKKRVMWRLCTACDILNEAEIPCKWIPVFPVFGDEVDLDGKVIRSGLVRHAKDPARMYNYWMTAATEEVALRTKTPFIGAEGQFEGHEAEWAAANVTSFPYLEYKPTALDGKLMPPPSRQPMADVPIGTITMARTASDDVKATTGLFDSSLGARGTATSGIQERAQQLQGDTANFHYADNLQITRRHDGRCLLDMLPRIYDGERIVRIMGEDEKITAQAVNGPEGVDITGGDYDLTIGVGPSYSTARQETTENLIELGQNWPELKQVAGDIIIRDMDFVGSDKIADRLKRTVPPAILGNEEGQEDAGPMVQTPQGPVPPEQASQMMAEMAQQMQEMAQGLQEAQSGIDKAQIEAQKAIEVAQINSRAKLEAAQMSYASAQDVAELRGYVDLLLQKMQPPPVLAADVTEDLAEDDRPKGAA